MRNDSKQKIKFLDLHGKRIDLITVNEDGLWDMHEYSTKPEFYQYLEYDPFTTIGETKKYLKRLIDLTNSTSHYWFIKLKEQNKAIGTFGVINIEWQRSNAEIAYGLSPNYWKQGFFREALLLVLDYLFLDLQFYRITARTQFNNTTSISSLEKCGFMKEGRLRDYLMKDGKRYDLVVLGILKGEYLKNKPQFSL